MYIINFRSKFPQKSRKFSYGTFRTIQRIIHNLANSYGSETLSTSFPRSWPTYILYTIIHYILWIKLCLLSNGVNIYYLWYCGYRFLFKRCVLINVESCEHRVCRRLLVNWVEVRSWPRCPHACREPHAKGRAVRMPWGHDTDKWELPPRNNCGSAERGRFLSAAKNRARCFDLGSDARASGEKEGRKTLK